MQIVIDIDEATYDDLMNGLLWHDTLYKEDIVAVLPKNHGRLIDADAIKYNHVIERALWDELCVTKSELCNAPTIIEADKAESESEE